MKVIRLTETQFINSLTTLMEVNDVESDIADLTDRLEDLEDDYEHTKGRVDYIRQLTADFLDYLQTLNNELDGQIEIPKSLEDMEKIMGRSERKRYYMSKFRL